MSWIRDLAASLSLDWNIKMRGGRARWKSRYGWLWVWSWKTNGIQLLSKAIRTWLDCILICNFSGWSFITGMDVSWELFRYICWYCVLNPRCEPSLQLKYLHITKHSFEWSDQTRCFLFNFCPAHSLRGKLFGEAAFHPSIPPPVSFSIIPVFPPSFRVLFMDWRYCRGRDRGRDGKHVLKLTKRARYPPFSSIFHLGLFLFALTVPLLPLVFLLWVGFKDSKCEESNSLSFWRISVSDWMLLFILEEEDASCFRLVTELDFCVFLWGQCLLSFHDIIQWFVTKDWCHTFNCPLTHRCQFLSGLTL